MDVTANLVTAEQLTQWMTAAAGVDQANQDQWCYALAQIVGTPCPNYDVGNPPTVRTSAQVFLDALRNYQLGINASTQQPGGATINGTGGATVPIPSPSAAPTPTPTPMGMGMLGPTNCVFCQWLKANPLFIVLALVALYFAFFYKK